MLTSLLERFRRDPLQGIVVLSVLTVHFLFLIIVLVSPSFAFRKKEHKPLIVKTIIPKSVAIEKKSPRPLSTQAPKVAATPMPKAKPQPQHPTPPKTQPAAKTQVQPQKKPAANTTTAKSTPPGKKEPAIADKTVSKTKTSPQKKSLPPPPRAKISDSLMQELEESIAKIETKSDKGAAGKRTPASSQAFAPISLQIDTPSGDLCTEDVENDYTDLIVQHLRQALSLPDFGEVKIQLSLRQDGTVAKVIVLKAQSEKNKHYLETNLPSLRFPRPDGAYANKKEQSFILTFCNEL